MLNSVLLACFPPMPESPRCRLSKPRYENAVRSMKVQRPKTMSSWADASRGARDQSCLAVHVHKSDWASIFSLNTTANLRRASLVLIDYTYQMINGEAAVENYAAIFYRAHDYAAQGFTYPVFISDLEFVCRFPWSTPWGRSPIRRSPW